MRIMQGPALGVQKWTSTRPFMELPSTRVSKLSGVASKTKGDRYVLSHRDRGYIATLNNEEEVDRRIAMEEARR